MKQETVMICLEKMGIGGVETSVLNQILAMTKKNIKVIVLAQEGIYTKKCINIGAKFINWNFRIKNNIDLDKIISLKEIMEENNVTQVIINQIPCINDVIFACFLANIPYSAYVHSTYKAFENEDRNYNVYEYFMHNYPIYKELLPLFFLMSKQVITITNVSKEYLINKFNIEESKIIVIPNSIDFNEYTSVNSIINITNFLLISRFSDEKMDSIKQALRFFKNFSNNKYCFLTIIGDGNKNNEILGYVKKLGIENNVEFLGAVDNVKECIENSDCVIGVDRCLLEAIAMNRLAIISGYSGLKGIVTKENIKACIDENFSGRLLKNVKDNDLIQYINSLSKEDILNITNDNYTIAKKKLDINKNIYFLYTNTNFIDNTTIIYEIIKIIEKYSKNIDIECKNKLLFLRKYNEFEIKYNSTIESYKNIVNEKEKIIEQKQIEIDRLNLELYTIYSSRSYIYLQKIKKLLNIKNK